jgi:uncharacterized protein
MHDLRHCIQASRSLRTLPSISSATAPSESARCYFAFLFALQNLFGRDVDLVETAAVQNPYFLQSIAKDRVLLYAA